MVILYNRNNRVVTTIVKRKIKKRAKISKHNFFNYEFLLIKNQFWLKIGELKQKILELTKELERERKDKEAMKSQATSLEKEYDRLTEEYSKLERRLTVTGGSPKDD